MHLNNFSNNNYILCNISYYLLCVIEYYIITFKFITYFVMNFTVSVYNPTVLVM